MAYRGLLIPDHRWKLENVASSSNGSDYREVGPLPGVPTDQNSPRSRMTLQASGSIPFNADMTITVVDTGFPGDGARIKWRSETLGVTHGWDPGVCLTGMEWVNRVTDASTAFRTDHPHALRLQSGDVLIACRIVGTTATGSNTEYATGIYRWEASDDGSIAYISRAFSSTDDQSGAQMKSPCLLQLPSGRVLCFDWDVTSTSPGLQLMVASSDDDGETWSDYSRKALASPIDDADYDVTQYSRIRAAYSNGQILLFAQLYDGGAYYMAQWASDDLGTTFRAVDENLGAGFSINVLAKPSGGFVAVYVVGTTVTCRHVASAFDSIVDGGTSATISPPDLSDEVCVWDAEDGSLWAAGTSTQDNDHIWSLVSRDEGLTWMEVGSISSAAGTTGTIDAGIWVAEETGIGLLRYTAAETRGRTILVCEPDPETDTNCANSLLALYLGGHSNITLPRSNRSDFGRKNDAIGWRHTYAGFEDPADNAAWTASTTGTPTCDTDANGWEIQLDAGEARAYSLSAAYIDDDDISATDYLFFVDMTPNNGGATNTSDIAFRALLADGTDDYEFSLRIASDTTGFAIYDHNAGSNVFAPVAVSLSATQFLIYVKGSSGVVRVYYRTGITQGHPLRTWTSAGSGTLTNDTATPNTGGALQWGSISAVAGATRSHWRLVCYTSVPSAYGYDPSLSTSLGARHLPTPASPITLGNGTRVAGSDGPAIAGESWNILPKFTNGIEKMFSTFPSPRQTFLTEQRGPTLIAVALDNELTVTDSTSVGLALRNTNIREFEIEGYDGSNWVNVSGTIINGWQDLQVTRKGDVLVVNTGASTSDDQAPWIPYERLAGSYVEIDNGMDDPVYCRIVHNTSGRMSHEAGLRPVIQLHPDDVAGAPTSGTAWIVPKDVTVLLHDLDDSYSRIRLSIPDAEYPDADADRVRIGVALYGPLVYFGRQYSATRSIETNANVDLQTRRSGTRTSRVLGPPRRRVAFAWLDPIDMTQLAAAGSTSPTSFTATGYAGQAVAAEADTPLLAEGVYERLQGGHTPLMYLPSVERPAGGAGSTVVVVINDPNDHLYARVVSSVRRETVLGDESASEAVRIAEIVLEEEV